MALVFNRKNMQLNLFNDAKSVKSSTDKIVKGRSGAFTDNMKLPVHRWFRYSAGFSAEWVQKILREKDFLTKPKILDPFCGSGTTLLAASALGYQTTGFEAHPFITRVARAKTQHINNIHNFEEYALIMLHQAEKCKFNRPKTQSDLLLRCYTEENLTRLEALRSAFEKLKISDEAIIDLLWLALTSILRECSGAGTAQWQYILPKKNKFRVKDPFVAFEKKIKDIIYDLNITKNYKKRNISIIETDARHPKCNDLFDMVITSPPYPNNYDYADATRLEMTFWGEVSSWGDLQQAVRQYLIRACSQHSAAERLILDDYLSKDLLFPIQEELSKVCYKLDSLRKEKGGRKTYHTMVAAYFSDLAEVWESLRRLVIPGGEVAFMIGDSAPYGVYLPCDKWMGELAIASGFLEYKFEKIRDRNIKWKNRKHNIPLKEGILWVKG